MNEGVERRCGSGEWDTDVRYFYWTSAVWMHGRPFNPIRLIALPIHMGSLCTHPLPCHPLAFDPFVDFDETISRALHSNARVDRKQMDLEELELFYLRIQDDF